MQKFNELLCVTVYFSFTVTHEPHNITEVFLGDTIKR